MLDAERGESVEDRVDDGLRRGDATGLTRALDAERIGGGRQFIEDDVERRQIAGARQRVIQQRPARQLARLRVVDRVLEQRLADALRNAALDLALGQQRIDQPAVIVDRGIAFEADGAGFRIDLNLGEVAAVWKRDDVADVEDMAVETGRHAFRQVRGVGRGAGDRQQAGARARSRER